MLKFGFQDLQVVFVPGPRNSLARTCLKSILYGQVLLRNIDKTKVMVFNTT